VKKEKYSKIYTSQIDKMELAAAAIKATEVCKRWVSSLCLLIDLEG